MRVQWAVRCVVHCGVWQKCRKWYRRSQPRHISVVTVSNQTTITPKRIIAVLPSSIALQQCNGLDVALLQAQLYAVSPEKTTSMERKSVLLNSSHVQKCLFAGSLRNLDRMPCALGFACTVGVLYRSRDAQNAQSTDGMLTNCAGSARCNVFLFASVTSLFLRYTLLLQGLGSLTPLQKDTLCDDDVFLGGLQYPTHGHYTYTHDDGVNKAFE